MQRRQGGDASGNGGGDTGMNASSGGSSSSTHPTTKNRKRIVRKSTKAAFTTFYGDVTTPHPVLVMFLILIGLGAFYGFFWTSQEERPERRRLMPAFLSKRLSALGDKSSYHVPGSIDAIGDKSYEYGKLREEYDAIYPQNTKRSLEYVQSLHDQKLYRPIPIPKDDADQFYDVFDCPDEPPKGYPFAWPILDVLRHWSPDDPTPRQKIHQGLCVFDFQKDFQKAMNYRNAELPFVTRHDPSVAATVERWNAPGYMERLMNTVPHRTEYSINNHFMYWMRPNTKLGNPKKRHSKLRGPSRIKAPSNWSQPTQMMRMPYSEWLEHANVTDDKLGPDKEHWYYRLIGCGHMGNCDKGSSEYLFDELLFFQPRKDDPNPPSKLYLVEPSQQKGIHCRFGMKGVIAENHFDGSRNSIVVLGGTRRYILSHPDQCQKLSLFPKEHPSARHSAVDWSDPDLEAFPDFEDAETNEVVLQPGDVLYLPTNWFHYIISLTLNFQCNTRSGINHEYMRPIHECGF